MSGNKNSGRKPKPKPLHLVGGLAPNQKFTMGVPTMPEVLQLDPLAQTYWATLTTHLQTHGIMAHEYGPALAVLACMSADYQRAREQFAQLKFKAFATEQRGARVVVVEAPILKRLNELAATLTRALGEFGLTPATAIKVFGSSKAAPQRKWDVLAGPR